MDATLTREQLQEEIRRRARAMRNPIVETDLPSDVPVEPVAEITPPVEPTEPPKLNRTEAVNKDIADETERLRALEQDSRIERSNADAQFDRANMDPESINRSYEAADMRAGASALKGFHGFLEQAGKSTAGKPDLSFAKQGADDIAKEAGTSLTAREAIQKRVTEMANRRRAQAGEVLSDEAKSQDMRGKIREQAKARAMLGGELEGQQQGLDAGARKAQIETHDLSVKDANANHESDVSRLKRANYATRLKVRAGAMRKIDPSGARALEEQANSIMNSQMTGAEVDSLPQAGEVMPQADTSALKFGAKTDDSVRKLAKDVDEAENIRVAFDNLEAKLGDLNDKKTHDKNLAGFNFPGAGRVSFYSEDAREIDSLVQGIVGPLSTARYGSAQTKTELAKFAKEMADGKFNTQGEMLKALQRLKQSNERDIAQAKAGYNAGVVGTYEGNMNRESVKVPGAPKSKQPVIKEAGGTKWEQLPDGSWEEMN